jgi:hypothetical protein
MKPLGRHSRESGALNGGAGHPFAFVHGPKLKVYSRFNDEIL